jgi:hypothetical protein
MIYLHIDPDSARYEYRMVIDQRTYTIRMDWNDRDSSWYMNLKDDNDAYLLVGQRIAVGCDLFRNKAIPGMPQGVLLCLDTTGLQEDPGFSDLDTRHYLIYASPSEL